MKYIRTKDGIKLFDGPYHRYELDKQADTIEELFDEQIVEYNNKSGKVIKREFVNHIYDGEIPEGEPEYYGAVRTETGLRYVAEKIEGEWRMI